ncbi:MAG TPA: type IV pilus biogenesis/stability protein PilW [Gammaproteobacteria bacterium]|nr:type IV pilus biogenesis/stability protein PilW [Gammaproteobacteria bacterium]
MKKLIWMLVLLSSLLTACGKQDEVRDEPVDKISKINLELGIAYMRERKYPEAMDNLQRAKDYNPDDPRIYSALALLYDRIGESDKAESTFEKAISMDENDSMTRNNYGAFLCKNGRYKEAYTQYKAALDNPLYTTPEYAHTNAGLCAVRSKDPEKAETEFRAALQKNPKFSIALFQMAKLSYEKDRMLQTRAYLQRFAEVSEPGPASLWLSIRVEKKLGDKNAVASQSLLLKAKYPDSEETRQLLDTEQHE